MARRTFHLLPVVVVIFVFLSGCTATVDQSGGNTRIDFKTPTATSKSTSNAKEPNWGVQTKTAGCKASGPIQDKACTPGDIFKDATKAQICVSGYAGKVRNVPQSVKNAVYAAYGVKTRKPGQYEVDHLVSLQLGGSNDISNLWPEPASPKPGFHEKDRVENYLHDQLCTGKMTLKQVQVAIATDWLAVYNKMPQSSKSGSDSGGEGNG